MRTPPTMATRLTADPTSIETLRRKRAARMPWEPLRRDQKAKWSAFEWRRAASIQSPGICERGSAACCVRASALFVVPVAHRVDVDEHAIFETQPPHQLVGAEV